MTRLVRTPIKPVPKAAQIAWAESVQIGKQEQQEEPEELKDMSGLTIEQSLELQRRVLGERPEVRNCRFDNNKVEQTNLIVHSAGEYVKYEGIPQETKCTSKNRLNFRK
jgi:hypothetical protein